MSGPGRTPRPGWGSGGVSGGVTRPIAGGAGSAPVARPPGGNGVAPGAPSQTPNPRPGVDGAPDVGGGAPANRPPGTQPGGADVPGTNQPRPGADGGGADVPGQNRPPAGGDAGTAGSSAAPARTGAGGALSGALGSAGIGLGLAGLTGAFSPGGFGSNLLDAGANVANTALVIEGVKAVIDTLTGAAGAAFEQLADNPMNLAIVAGVVALVVLR